MCFLIQELLINMLFIKIIKIIKIIRYHVKKKIITKIILKDIKNLILQQNKTQNKKLKKLKKQKNKKIK